MLLVEPADNIGGGAPGDGTDVMRALLKYDMQGAGVAIADPESVAALQNVPIGGKITLPIGGKGSPLDPGPVTLEVELISRSDGVFELEDKNSHLVGSLGKIIRMGPSAVVQPSRPHHPAHQQEAAALRPGPMAQPGHQSRRAQHDRHQGGGGPPRRLWQDRVGRIHRQHLGSLHLRHHPAALHQAAPAGVSAGPAGGADDAGPPGRAGRGGPAAFPAQAWRAPTGQPQPHHQRHDAGRAGAPELSACSTPG